MTNKNNNKKTLPDIFTLKQFIEDSYGTLLSLGYSEMETSILIDMKSELHNHDEKAWDVYTLQRHQLKLARIIPLYCIMTKEEWESSSSEDKDDVMFELGIDVTTSYFLDVGVFTFNDQRDLGYFIIGNERTDPDWLNLTFDGCKVASFEAQMWGCDPDLLSSMNGFMEAPRGETQGFKVSSATDMERLQAEEDKEYTIL